MALLRQQRNKLLGLPAKIRLKSERNEPQVSQAVGCRETLHQAMELVMCESIMGSDKTPQLQEVLRGKEFRCFRAVSVPKRSK